MASLLIVPCIAQDASPVTELRGMLDKWVDVQKALSKEKSDAAMAKELLQQRTELVQRELEDLRKKKIESEAAITEADTKKAELVTKKDEAEAILESLKKDLPSYEDEVKALRPRLPDPVKEKLAPLFDRIPEGDKADKVSLAERFQNIVGILNEVNKANLEVNLVSEVRPIDGKPTEVKTLYVGLAQGYYVNATGQMAGKGRPGADGWIWEQDNTLARAVKSAMAMLQAKGMASFIAAPAHID